MQCTWQSLRDRARVYVDDDHEDTGSFLSDVQWLAILNVEYAQLYRRWVRSGLVTPVITEVAFTGATAAATGVLAIVGVAEDLGDYPRILPSAQVNTGRDSTWFDMQPAGPATTWGVTGNGDDLTVTLYPAPSSGSYVVRYIPTQAAIIDPTPVQLLDPRPVPLGSVDLPYGGDERLVLGMARRANLKGAAASGLLERLIMDADAELNFTAAGRINGPRVRTRFNYPPRTERFGNVWPAGPGSWVFV